MTTVHANTPRDAISRIESMVGMGSVSLSEGLTRQTIARAINLIVQLTRGTDGKRRISSVSEVIGMESSVITIQEIFKFDQKGTDKDGKILGEYRATGIRAKALEKIERYGINPAEVVRPFLEG
jgi:pilus assembly protein CpaF